MMETNFELIKVGYPLNFDTDTIDHIEIQDLLKNPGIGWRAYARRPELNNGFTTLQISPLVSILYFPSVAPSDVNPSDGVYDWSIVDEILDFCDAHGLQLHFKMTPGGQHNPGSTNPWPNHGRDPIPVWAAGTFNGVVWSGGLFERGYWTRGLSHPKPFLEPKYTDTAFQQWHADLWEAFWGKYWTDDRWQHLIAAVDIASFGAAGGEWWGRFDFQTRIISWRLFSGSALSNAPITLKFDDHLVERAVLDDDGHTDGTWETSTRDAFQRTISLGWGIDDYGNAYTPAVANTSVDGSSGVISMVAANQTTVIDLPSVSERDLRVSFMFQSDKKPNGSSVVIERRHRKFVPVSGQQTYYRHQITLTTAGQIQVRADKVVLGVATQIGTTLTVVPLFVANTKYFCKLECSSIETPGITNLKAKVWTAADNGPADYDGRVRYMTPLSYWRFVDSEESTQAVDDVGIHNGTISGTVARGAPLLLDSPDTSFDFLGGKVDMGDWTDFSGTSPFSISAWVKGRTLNDGAIRRVIGKRDSATTPGGWRIHATGTGSAGRFQFVREAADGSATTLASTSAPVVDAIYHLVATYDGTTMKLYVNAALMGSAASALSMPDNATPLLVGNDITSTRPWDGFISKPAIWSRTLTPTEISILYAIGSTGSLPGEPDWQHDVTDNEPSLQLDDPNPSLKYNTLKLLVDQIADPRDANAGGRPLPTLLMNVKGMRQHLPSLKSGDPAAVHHAVRDRGAYMMLRNAGPGLIRAEEDDVLGKDDLIWFVNQYISTRKLVLEWGSSDGRIAVLTGGITSGLPAVATWEGVQAALRHTPALLGWYRGNSLTGALLGEDWTVGAIPAGFENEVPEAAGHLPTDVVRTDPLAKIFPGTSEHIRDYLQTRVGYRFVVAETTYPQTIYPGFRFAISQRWVQLGDAKLYNDRYKVKARLVGSTTVELVTDPLSFDADKWGFGDNSLHEVVSSFPVPDDLPIGTYELQFALIDQSTDQPAINLAILGKTSSGLAFGWYPIANVDVQLPDEVAYIKVGSLPGKVGAIYTKVIFQGNILSTDNQKPKLIGSDVVGV